MTEGIVEDIPIDITQILQAGEDMKIDSTATFLIGIWIASGFGKRETVTIKSFTGEHTIKLGPMFESEINKYLNDRKTLLFFQGLTQFLTIRKIDNTKP